MLDVVIYYRQPQTPSAHVRMFAEGLARHSIRAEIRSPQLYRRSDLAVFWAHKQQHIIQQQRDAGLDYLVMERGYFGDRFAMTSLGFNGLNGHAEFHNQNSPGDRWQRYGVPVSAWKQEGDGEVIVVMGQVPTDASLKNCPNYRAWIHDAARKAEAVYGRRVYFRPHPHPSASTFRPNLPLIGGTLESALERACAALVWNSNSGVDTVLAGVPLICGDRGSMAWPMATQVIGDPLIRPDRYQWLNDLAYTQWSDSEIMMGDAWNHLRQRFDSRKTAAA
jgi:hypothetical protein